MYGAEVKFEELIGKTIVEISGGTAGDEQIVFTTSDGSEYRMYHRQDCCENVRINDLDGDIRDLIGSVILEADERTNTGDKPDEYADSWTWTFYTLRNVKASVTIRWLGESNGYYSEDVTFEKIK